MADLPNDSQFTNHSELPSLLMRDVPAEFERQTGVRPHRNTIRRWRRDGSRGVRLRVLRVGGRYQTSPQAVADFIAESNLAQAGGNQTRLSPAAVRANDLATEELKRMGVL